MVGLVLVPQAQQNLHGSLTAGFLHRYRLEPPLQRRVLLNIPPVFIPCRRADDTDFRAAESGFQNIGGIHRPLCAARAHNGMEFVNKEDDVAHAPDFRQRVFYPLLKLAPVFCPRQHGGQVDGQNIFPQQLLRHVPCHNLLGQALGYGGLAHPRLPDENRVIFGPAGENTDGPSDLSFPSNYRVQPSFHRQGVQAPGKLLQRLGHRGWSGGGQR